MAKVNTQHAEYIDAAALWARCRDFAAGSDKVKEGGEGYLPKLGGQTDDEYEAYKSRAQFYNATGRTIEGMGGLVMRIDPVVDLPSQLADLEDDVDYQGTSLFEFAKLQVLENLTVGRTGILVDMPVRTDQNTTQARAEALGLRPYLAHYTAESIYSWRTQRIGGAVVLTQVVLQEFIETVDPQDEFLTTSETRFRVLDLGEAGYKQRIFKANKDNKDWTQDGDDIVPTMGGKPLTFIPFVFIGTRTNTPDVQKPPVADLVDVNLGHYRNSADLEHGLHFTALPTPVITGHSGSADEAIAIGSETFLVLKSPNAKAFFMEFSGAGLTPMQSAMDKKEGQMASLGARMLSTEKKGVEAADTARIHRSGEAGVLASMAGSVTKGIKRALNIAAEWAGAAAGSAEFQLNKDFLPINMDPGMLRELLAAWQSGGISMPVLFDNLKRGELIRDDVTLEDMQEDIDNNIPGGGPPGGPAPDDGTAGSGAE